MKLAERVAVVTGAAQGIGAACARAFAEAGARVCVCPTTEANLGDRFAPVAQLCERGIGVCIGSDSHVRRDPPDGPPPLESHPPPPAAPPRASEQPKITRRNRTCTIAPAHIGHGSFVT